MYMSFVECPDFNFLSSRTQALQLKGFQITYPSFSSKGTLPACQEAERS